jgi:hypothetical protein
VFIVCAVLSVLLAVILAASAQAMLAGDRQIARRLRRVGVDRRYFPHLAGFELAGAAGLVLGLVIPVIGIVAAAGVMAYFAGAVLFHRRAGDPEVGPPASLAALALLTLVFRIATA